MNASSAASDWRSNSDCGVAQFCAEEIGEGDHELLTGNRPMVPEKDQMPAEPDEVRVRRVGATRG